MKAHMNLPAPGKHAMKAEIQRQMAEYDRKNWEEIDAMVLWVLRTEFGFGEKRLRRFYDSFNSEMQSLLDRYELDDCDTPWLCTRKLKDAGIDISKWSKED